MKIKEALTIDLSEDIKNVIDIEDVSEAEIQSEIEKYIITDGLAKEYADFASTFISNISETGVWISGFYGSGKSYFGKLLGYMLSNRMIAGTSARDRLSVLVETRVLLFANNAYRLTMLGGLRVIKKKACKAFIIVVKM